MLIRALVGGEGLGDAANGLVLVGAVDVMTTGTGNTRVATALIDVFLRTNQVQNVLSAIAANPGDFASMRTRISNPARASA